MNIVVINPASPEVNRGSFCYLPYLYVAYLTRLGHEVHFFEDFTMPELDAVQAIIDKDPTTIVEVAIWSYPQVEWARMLNMLLPVTNFFGYTPMLREAGLKYKEISSDVIACGSAWMPYMFADNSFKHVLLSDCDAHLAELGDAQMYPLFTSYGCNRGCSFCPSAANTCNQRHVLSIEVVHSMLSVMHKNGMHNIHFTDEDFFFDAERAFAILSYANNLSTEWNFIALASVQSLTKFIDTFLVTHNDILQCVKLVEVGLESADEHVAGRMGKGARDAKRLAQICPVNILWLTMTFSPDDTIHSHYVTGRFLERHGLRIEAMNKRIITNGTVGGLGQFFQMYEGTPLSRISDESKNTMTCGDGKGLICSTTPTRLVPSYIPLRMITEEIKSIRVVKQIGEEETEQAMFWARMYRCEDVMNTYLISIRNSGVAWLSSITLTPVAVQWALCLVILARLGYIDTVEEQ